MLRFCEQEYKVEVFPDSALIDGKAEVGGRKSRSFGHSSQHWRKLVKDPTTCPKKISRKDVMNFYRRQALLLWPGRKKTILMDQFLDHLTVIIKCENKECQTTRRYISLNKKTKRQLGMVKSVAASRFLTVIKSWHALTLNLQFSSKVG